MVGAAAAAVAAVQGDWEAAGADATNDDGRAPVTGAAVGCDACRRLVGLSAQTGADANVRAAGAVGAAVENVGNAMASPAPAAGASCVVDDAMG